MFVSHKSLTLLFLFFFLFVPRVPSFQLWGEKQKVTSGEWLQQACYPLKCPPSNVHLAVINSTSMSISWQTLYNPTTSTVVYGLTESLGQTSTGTSFSYQHSNSNYTTFYNHDVVLVELEPSTLYYYQAGDPQAGWSPLLHFYTPPSPPNETNPFPAVNSTIIVYGDMGIDLNQMVASRLDNLVPPIGYPDKVFDFILHTGDMSYANSFPPDMYEEIWNAWFATLTNVMQVRPYMVAVGNHEYNCGNKACYPQTQNFTAYNSRFRMPSLESGGAPRAGRNMWYSFDYGNVHYCVIDTETDYPNAPEGTTMFGNQLAWIKNDLQEANKNRNNIPWLIVVGHRPIYSSSTKHFSTSKNQPSGSSLTLAQAMENLFLENNIDFYLSSHYHAYERTYPMTSPTEFSTSYINPTAPVYITSGSAGSSTGLDTPWIVPSPAWSGNRNDQDYGYGVLQFYDDVENKQHVAQWLFVNAETNEIFDQFSLIKDI